MYRIQSFKTFHYHITGFQLVSAFHFRFRHICRAGNSVMEIIRMSCSDVRNVASCLCPGSRISRVSVYHSANLRKCFVKYYVSRSIRGWLQSSFNDLAIQIHYYHIFGLHIIITYTTGFDYYQSAFTVDSRDIAPGKDD